MTADTAVHIAADVAAGRRRATDVVSHTLDRIAALNPLLNAFTAITAERALARAAAIDAAVAAGRPAGALAGVPFAVKNLIDVAGLATLAGSRINRDRPPAEAAVALRLGVQEDDDPVGIDRRHGAVEEDDDIPDEDQAEVCGEGDGGDLDPNLQHDPQEQGDQQEGWRREADRPCPGSRVGVAEAGEDQREEGRCEGRLLARARSRFLRGLHRG